MQFICIAGIKITNCDTNRIGKTFQKKFGSCDDYHVIMCVKFHFEKGNTLVPIIIRSLINFGDIL